MKRATVLALLVCLSVVTGSAKAADAPEARGVRSLDAAWTKAVLAGDAAALAALYADDAVLVLPGAPAARGEKAIAESFAGWFKDTKVTEFVLSDSRYRTEGRLSAGWGRYRMTTVPKAGGVPMTETGTYSGVAVETNGVWKYVSDNASAEPAPPAKK